MDKFDNLTVEEIKRFEIFCEKGIIPNTYLHDSVMSDRVVAIDKDGNKKVFKNVGMAVEHFAGDETIAKKANIKYRIRQTIINQDNKKIFKHYWDVHDDDYMARI